ncbi:MAG: CusA/CzcA family heavy metal efflux RND transporter [Candidatus Methylomirabilota bacterium]|nr:efflux RND transporter permease subunit [candidate division NC10 bacterium]PWB48485.1 MAG: CusA/CzcA family heavy metal efflux RND transporter [candidate division NC10 bacterium]
MFAWIIERSLTNRILVVVAFVVVLIVGLFTLRRITLDVFPEFAPPQVVIQTEAPSLPPQDVELLITFPIESAINGTPGVEVIRSKSTAGLSSVIVVFEWGTNIYSARQLVNERLQAVKDRLPPGTKSPMMLPITSAVGWLVKYALTSDSVSLMDLRTISDWVIRNRLLAIPGVASVVSIGGEVKQYQVLLSSDKLFQYGLTTKEILDAVRQANVSVPGGFLVTPGQEFVITGAGRISSLDELRQTKVAERGGTPIRLDQVATVRFGPEFKRGDATWEGKPAVIGTVSKLFGADTLTVTYQVEQALEEIRKTLPPGVELNTQVFRQASFIESSIANLRQAILEGVVVVSIVVILFLFNVRASLITLTALPTSLISGVLVLKAFGIGINAMTLGGLAIAIGEVVDDAIVDVENIVRRLRLNQEKVYPDPPLRVIYEASVEIRHAVVHATWIVLIVFMPIFLLGGVEGRIFTPLGLAYVSAILASLVVAVTLVPALAAMLLIRRGEAQPEQESLTVRAMKRVYEALLRPALHRPWKVITVCMLLISASLAVIPFLGRSFLPEFREGNFILQVTMLPGISLAESMRVGERIVRMLKQHPEVVSVSQRAGRAELDEEALPPNVSEFDMAIRYSTRDPELLLHAIREHLEKIPGVATVLGQFIAHRLDEVLSGIRAQIAIKIYGPDLVVLREKGRQVEQIMREIDGVTDLLLEPLINVPGVRITVDRDEASRLGLDVGAILEMTEVAFGGRSVSRVVEGQRGFDLFVWFDETSRKDRASMRNLLIDAPEGRKVPLRLVADLEIVNSPFMINRERLQRRIVVQANVADRDLISVIHEAQRRLAGEVQLPAGYFIEYGGQFESEREAARVLMVYGGLAVTGIFLMLHKAFGSSRAALLVMVNLPLALIGGVAAILLTGMVTSVPSLIGFISVFGITARNGIILVSHYRHLRSEGVAKEEAIIQGSKDRLAPILMTAASTALGLLPLLFGEATGKELERPLAQVILGGLFTSTLLNMIVVPTLFMRFGWEREETFRQQLALERGDLFRPAAVESDKR